MIRSRILISHGAMLTGALVLLPVIALSGRGTATAAPQRAAVSAVVLHVEQPGAKFAAAGATLGQARVGQPVRITLYASITGAASPGVAQVRLSAAGAGKAVLISAGTFPISRAQMQGSASGWRWFYNTVRPAKPGRYDVSGSFAMNGTVLTRHTVLTVTG